MPEVFHIAGGQAIDAEELAQLQQQAREGIATVSPVLPAPLEFLPSMPDPEESSVAEEGPSAPEPSSLSSPPQIAEELARMSSTEPVISLIPSVDVSTSADPDDHPPCQCLRCGHRWKPRPHTLYPPRSCASCRSTSWAIPPRGDSNRLVRLAKARAAAIGSYRESAIRRRWTIALRKYINLLGGPSSLEVISAERELIELESGEKYKKEKVIAAQIEIAVKKQLPSVLQSLMPPPPPAPMPWESPSKGSTNG